jgi:hypothetical protein
MDIKRKTHDFRTWGKIYFSPYPPIFVPSFYQCVETRSAEGFLSVVSATSAHGRVTSATIKRLTVNRKHFFMNTLSVDSFWPQKKRTTERCPSVVYFSSTVAILITETSV